MPPGLTSIWRFTTHTQTPHPLTHYTLAPQGIIGSKDSKERQILLNPTVREQEQARLYKMLTAASSKVCSEVTEERNKNTRTTPVTFVGE